MPYKNKEERAAYHRAYRERNRYKFKESSKKYYDKIHSDSEAVKKENKRKYEERAAREENKVNVFYVYLLPNEHYVGYTNDFKRRIKEHQKIDTRRDSSKSMDTAGAVILKAFFCPMEAHLYETKQHIKGYKGFKR